MENDWENIHFPKVGYSQTNIAIFKNGPRIEDVFRIQHEDIPASYVILPEVTPPKFNIAPEKW